MKRLTLSLLVAISLCSAGCRMMEYMPGNLYVRKDKTTYRTPNMRIDAIREIANRSDNTDSPRQRELVSEMARQIQIEPDPLVRQQIVYTVAEFNVPLAEQILVAGLNDNEDIVRIACCEKLGTRANPATIDPLADVVASKTSMQVRLAATQALGNFQTPAASSALTAALADRDPALQYAAVESMKRVTGKDYGTDVSTWLQVAQESSAASQPAASVAQATSATQPR